MVAYRCDLFKDAGYGKGNTDDTKMHMQTIKNPEGEEIFKEYKNYCVIDDSSKFAAAVYYHYINKEILKDEDSDNRIAYGIDLWETSSRKFLKESEINNTLIKTEKFEVHILDENREENKYDKGNLWHKNIMLKQGDLLCGNGNVDFYIGNNKYVGWGVINKQYYLIKHYEQNQANGYFYNVENAENNNTTYTTIIRFIRGGNSDEK